VKQRQLVPSTLADKRHNIHTFIGTAGWSVPAPHAPFFTGDGSHLARYSAVMNAAEINSSFHRPHQPKTYERWRATVGPDFRFSVKLPKTITHELRLTGCKDLLSRFFDESAGLGNSLTVVLVQLPPSLVYDARTADRFFQTLRRHTKAMIACEPRHVTWFSPEADKAMAKLEIARVAADPIRAAGGFTPGGWQGLRYWRLHGSPKLYYSSYSSEYLHALAETMRDGDWCIFDNTMSGAALGNALELKALTA
jgi:uncharacterized protein YecE (DUF72 family)